MGLRCRPVPQRRQTVAWLPATREGRILCEKAQYNEVRCVLTNSKHTGMDDIRPEEVGSDHVHFSRMRLAMLSNDVMQMEIYMETCFYAFMKILNIKHRIMRFHKNFLFGAYFLPPLHHNGTGSIYSDNSVHNKPQDTERQHTRQIRLSIMKHLVCRVIGVLYLCLLSGRGFLGAPFFLSFLPRAAFLQRREDGHVVWGLGSCGRA